MSAEYLDAHRSAIDGPDFRIEGYTFEAPTVDAGNDGIPDMGWTKGDIIAWMEEKSVDTARLLHYPQRRSCSRLSTNTLTQPKNLITRRKKQNQQEMNEYGIYKR